MDILLTKLNGRVFFIFPFILRYSLIFFSFLLLISILHGRSELSHDLSEDSFHGGCFLKGLSKIFSVESFSSLMLFSFKKGQEKFCLPLITFILSFCPLSLRIYFFSV